MDIVQDLDAVTEAITDVLEEANSRGRVPIISAGFQSGMSAKIVVSPNR